MKLFFVCFWFVFQAFISLKAEAAFLNPQSFVLKNGMRVVVLENHRSPVIYHSVWYRVGSADEDPSIPRGLAHFCEHMMFKGTTRFPQDAFNQTLQSIGGHHNAFTSFDCTAYYELVGQEHLETVMALEADRMRYLKITPSDVAKELKVVAEERRMRTDNQHSALLSEKSLACFFVNHPYGTPVIGWPQDIQKYTAEIVRPFYKKWYQPSNAILIVAGDVTVSRVRACAEKYFGKLSSPPACRRIRLQEPPSHGTSQEICRVSDQTQLPQLTFYFPMPTMLPSSLSMSAAIEVLCKIMGVGKTSRLYQTLVEKQKLASHASMSYMALRDQGLCTISLAPHAAEGLDALRAAFEKELQRLKTSPITAPELAQAKKRILGELDYWRDNMELSAYVVGSFLTNDIPLEALESWPQVLESVTLEDIQKAVDLLLFEYPRLVTTLKPVIQAPAAAPEAFQKVSLTNP